MLAMTLALLAVSSSLRMAAAPVTEGTAPGSATPLTAVPCAEVMQAPTPKEERQARANKAILVAGGVTAGLLADIGAVLAIVAASRTAEADRKSAELVNAAGLNACTRGPYAMECSALRGLRQDAANLGNAAVWSLIGAGVIGSATAIYGLMASSTKAPSGISIAPIVMGSGGGAVIAGSW